MSRPAWARFAARRPATAEFVVFTLISQGMTVLQLTARGRWWPGLLPRGAADYQWMIGRWGGAGEAGADVLTMVTDALISFVVFFPILKTIVRKEPAPVA